MTNFIACDLETHNTVRTRPYVFCFYRLSKLAGKYNRGLTPYQKEKYSETDTLVFDGDDSVSNVLDFCFKKKKK